MKIKNWEKFQHYKHRKPAWIKLYRDILDDIRVHKMSDGAFRFLINVILLASEDFGNLPDSEEVAFRLRMDKSKVNKYLKEVDYCVEHDAINTLADGYQDATTEKSRVEIDKSREDISKTQKPCTSKDVPYMEIVNLYHKILPTLPSVEKLTTKRKTYLKQRWQQDLPDLNHWENYFHHVNQSDFLMGKATPVNGRKVFRANLEWLTNESNFVKVSEDNYHG